MMQEKIDQLRSLLGEVQDLEAAAAVLEWDQETYMPPGAAQARAQQVATLHTHAHRLLTSDAVSDLLEQLAPLVADLDPHSTEASLVRVTRRDVAQARKIPEKLVGEFAEAVGNAKEAWKEARSTDTFAIFAPYLQRLVDLNLQKAEALGYKEHPYDALLDQFEPGMTTAEVARVFTDLRQRLVPLVEAIAERPSLDDSMLHRMFPEQVQWHFGVDVIRAMGYDFTRGRQDRSAHPFTTSFSITDVRVTTRTDPSFFNPAFFGTLHEAGHALYEQGIDLSLDRTPLADGTSLGIHESQSRLWENLVGRSRPFWEHYFPKAQAAFPEALGDASLDAFYAAINAVAPSLIRVEADEVTYNLHIMLRFELETALLEGTLAVADLPEAWNDRMDAYLGIRPTTDAAGVLQDIHWSLGALGYFPTYALGNLMSTQLFAQAQVDLTDLPGQIAAGEFADLLGWLRTHVHQHGRKKTAAEILHDVTGEGLSADSWLAYVNNKFGALYGL